jgi:hypothetical protein
MPEYRIKKSDIERARKELDRLIKDTEDSPDITPVRMSERELKILKVCNFLRGSGIRPHREKVPSGMKYLRGRFGRIRLFRG